LVAVTVAGVRAVPTTPVTVRLVTTGALPPPVAAVIVNVIVPLPEPAAFVAVTGIATPLARAVGVPDITPDALIASP
jgi:hypothetical protein